MPYALIQITLLILWFTVPAFAAVPTIVILLPLLVMFTRLVFVAGILVLAALANS